MLNPNPKNESVVSYTITDGIVEATSNIINPMVLGNRCFIIILIGEAPKASAAKTYSLSLN